MTLFAYGFRPFFLLTGVWAVVPMAVLWWSMTTGHWGAGAGTPFAWHGHEMLFGFVAAAIAGFLLTAVPSWTGTKAIAGPQLALLVLLWAAGRAAWAPVPFSAPVSIQAPGSHSSRRSACYWRCRSSVRAITATCRSCSSWRCSSRRT